jgi:hypothetical protein
MKDYILHYTVGAVIVALVNLGLFATRAEVAELKAEAYKSFAQREEIAKQLESINTKLDALTEKTNRANGVMTIPGM